MLYGYGGHTLRVDLGRGTTLREKSDPRVLRKAIGGRGLNALRLHDELERDTDPLSPENMLLIGVGPLTGTLLSASAPTILSGKSPLTGFLGASPVCGFLGAELKQAGYDQLVITGRADKPSLLVIADDRVEIRDAGNLWGRDTWETTSALRKELGDNSFQVAAIGPAGENQVRFATVACNNSCVGDGAGMGCLFGSKNLKAVAVKGTIPVTMADTLGFLDLCRELDRRIVGHPQWAERQELGSTRLMKVLEALGILPTNHFQKGVCPYVDRISGEALAGKYKVKSKSCFNCNIHCSQYTMTGDLEGEGPDFETLCAYTSRLGVDDLPFALKITSFLNRMGLDSVSSGETIGWAMECFEKGLLEPGDVDGLVFSWGNRETIEKILHRIVQREGIGEAFAQGTRSLAERFGRGTEKVALHVKGLDVNCADPRGLKALGLSHAVSSTGSGRLPVEPFLEVTGRYDEAGRRWGIRESADRLSDKGKAALVEHSERQALLADCLTLCRSIGLSMDTMDFDFASRLLVSGTGLPFTPERVDKGLRWILNAERRLDLDFGLEASMDTLPQRFTQEPLEEGPSRGEVVGVKDMVREYYQLRGWDEKGRPPS